MRDTILKYLSHSRTIAALIQQLEAEGYKPRGNKALVYPGNLLLWQGVSAEFAEIFFDLMTNNYIVSRECRPLDYFLDGEVMPFPVAKEKRPYKKVRWYPIEVKAA